MMSDSHQLVRLAPPPAPVLRVVNPLMRRVLPSPLGRLLGTMALIEFTGRRTGRRIRTPVSWHLVNGVAHTTTDLPWRWNFAGGAPVTVTYRGRAFTGRAVLLEMSPEQVADVLLAMLTNGDSPFTMGMRWRGAIPRPVTSSGVCASP
jgi:hypothetical protein